ncbi:MAG: hypothetical protein CL489_08670 [Acidobacteria bacterium]|nr:hypothetical protein [Acidobacteriota bacterium]|tara:strand:- start:32562 stop:33134 length:573 start_codon:yes stop_codon:yes gene_type:complete
MSKFLLTDIDGCVLNWHKGFISFCEMLGFKLDKNSDHTDYDMATWFTNMSSEQFRGLVTLFNNSQFSNLCPPLSDAGTYLPLIAKNHRVEALTAFGDRPEQKEMRKNLINALFPNVFDEIHVIDLQECKRSYLERIKPDIFIEDSLRHADSSLELGIETWMIKTPYNDSDKHQYLDKYEPWKDLYKRMGE